MLVGAGWRPFPSADSVCATPGAQTGQYSTQIFSLAVLLSSLFVYNQMGGIDEAALDRLSLVTEAPPPPPLTSFIPRSSLSKPHYDCQCLTMTVSASL